MARSYRLLCPIARALDRVGDRWTLLILRDLHAGPMRFGDLVAGLPGLATNLLTTRLETLRREALIEHRDGLYRLTALGERTDEVLWSLARLGMWMPPDPEPRRPGHLRLAAITLQNALRLVASDVADAIVELRLDGESFTILLGEGAPTVRYGAPETPDVVAATAYEPMMAAAGGEMPLSTFRADHVRLAGDPQAVADFRAIMTRVMVEGFAADAD